jgi:hypothetical protein
MAEIKAARFQGLVAFGQCLDGARITTGGFDSNGDLVVDAPNDPATVTAIQQALADLGFVLGVDGDYGPGTAEVVRQFKVQQNLALPPGLAQHDGVTGPGTSGRLDEIFSAARAVVRLRNEYGDALPGVGLTLTGTDGVARNLATDGDGAASADQGGPWSLTLDPGSALTALGDLLLRPWPPDPPPPALDLPPESLAVTTALNDVPVQLAAGADLTVVVAARLAFSAPLVAPLDGLLRTEGPGIVVGFDGEAVTLALQANGGSPVTVLIDPLPPGIGAPPLPDIPGWVPPNGYVVRPGDTSAGLGELFLGDPARFAELSDHEPVEGETLTLPAEAVPGWLARVTGPPPADPQPQVWCAAVPDDLLRVLHADADAAPLHDLLDRLDRPPSPGLDPAGDMADRAATVAMVAASPEVLGSEQAEAAAAAAVDQGEIA